MKIDIVKAIAYLTTSLVLTLVLTPILKELAIKIGAVDREGAGKRENKPGMPRLGGAAIFIAFICPVLILFGKAGNGIKNELGAILLGSLVVFLVGAYDDIMRTPIWMRLGVEVAAAGLVYLVGIRIATIHDLHGGTLPLGWLGLPLTILWIVIITNAMNFIDGLDGLASGTGILILLTILLLNFNTLDSLLLLGILALLGALLGFLFFNFPPASIYMGDSGSLFLGFFLSSFAILASRRANDSRIAWITLLAFSLPLLDMAYAIFRRWYRGVPIYSRDNDHLHHKLLQKGFSQRKIALLFYAANIVLMLALISMLWSGFKPALTFMILLILSLAAFAAFEFLSDLKPKDFVERIVRLFRMFRRRRYHLYLISRRHSAR